MKKATRVLTPLTLPLVAFTLYGCEEPPIMFEGQERPAYEVEDILGDRLEAENPGMDIEVDIYEEADE